MSETTDRRAALKRWLHARLTEGSLPREEWRELWRASWDHLLALPARELIDPDPIRALAEQLADPEAPIEPAPPIVGTAARTIVAELRGADQPLEDLLPPEARERLEQAVSRPGLIHPDWVRAVFRGEAAEEVLNDALYRTLKDFSTLFPRLLVKISPMGRFGLLGGAGAIAERLIDEVEKLIEPEIRSFLAESTGRILERTAEFTISSIDDPALTQFRSNLIGFMLSKSPAFFLQSVDDELMGDLGAIVELTSPYVSAMPETRENVQAWIDRVLAYLEDKSLAEALQLEESGAPPAIDTLADATWPAFSAVLTSPHARAWTDALVDELIDEYERIEP